MSDNSSIADLGERYPETMVGDNSKMKDRILHESTLLFAQRGYADVSMKDIAGRVGLKPASLYSHYGSKEELWAAVLHHMKGLYLQYFSRLDEAGKSATCFEELLDTMFVELKQVVSIFSYYGFSLVMTEQFRDDRAGDLILGTFLKFSVGYIAGRFQECVGRGWVEPFDTYTVAALFMNTVLSNNNLRIHEHRGAPVPYDINLLYENMQRLILTIARPKGAGALPHLRQLEN